MKSHFKFSKKERSGIFFLLLLIVVAQCVYFFADFSAEAVPVDKQEITAFQNRIDSLKAIKNKKPERFPFNPNYITDYKGYELGMSVNEIDRLLAFRETGKFVNSATQFQEVTKVSDSLLNEIRTYFKFPDWVKKGGQAKAKTAKTARSVVANIIRKDLNTVTADELKLISGIGPTLSARIVKFRKRLGGFLIDEQLTDVFGLKPEVAHLVLSRYTVLTRPEVTKININEATAYEISSVAYLSYAVSKEIVSLRDKKGVLSSFDELIKITEFPVEKISRIGLYLKFN